MEHQPFGRAALSFVGRILMGGVFLVSAAGLSATFGGVVGTMTSKGVPAPALVLGLVIGAWLIGGTCLVVGYRVRVVAPVLALLLVPVTLGMHAPWHADAASFQNELHHCLENFAFIGGLLCAAAASAGRFSLDARRRVGSSES